MSTISPNKVGWIPDQEIHNSTEVIPIDTETKEPTQTAIPLIKEPKPEGMGWSDYLEWSETEVRRKWQQGEPTREELRKIWRDGEHFLDSFTLQEQAAISLSTEPIVAALRLKLCARKAAIWSDDELTILGVNALIATGIITQERANEILTK